MIYRRPKDEEDLTPAPPVVVPPPAEVPLPEKYEPAVAKIVAPPPVEKTPLPEPRRQSFLESALSYVPAAVTGLAHMTRGGNAQTRQTSLGMLQQASEENAAADAKYDAERKNAAMYANAQRDKAAAAERQAKMDSLAFSKDKREAAKDVRDQSTFANQQQDRSEKRDPASQKNVAFRAQLQKAYPEVWAGMSEQERATMTVDDAPALALKQADRMRAKGDKFQEITHQQSEELRFNTNLPYNNGYGGPSSPSTPSPWMSELAKIYGGEDKVPPAMAARARGVENAARAGNKNLATLEQGLYDDASREMNETAKRGTDSRKEDTRYVAERRARNIDKLRSNLEAVKQALKGVQGDIPGHGATGGLPNVMISSKGKELRRKVRELLDTKIRIATGAAANAGEEQRFEDIVGAGAFATDADLVSGLAQAEKMLSDQEAFLDAGMPESAKRFRENLRPGGGPSVPSADDTVTVQNADGDTRSVPRRLLERAAKDGFHPVQ